jgi:hypothetical protein
MDPCLQTFNHTELILPVFEVESAIFTALTVIIMVLSVPLTIAQLVETTKLIWFTRAVIVTMWGKNQSPQELAESAVNL